MLPLGVTCNAVLDCHSDMPEVLSAWDQPPPVTNILNKLKSLTHYSGQSVSVCVRVHVHVWCVCMPSLPPHFLCQCNINTTTITTIIIYTITISTTTTTTTTTNNNNNKKKKKKRRKKERRMLIKKKLLENFL